MLHTSELSAQSDSMGWLPSKPNNTGSSRSCSRPKKCSDCGASGSSAWRRLPTPVPTTRATLRTTGPYRFVRHPIYTGVLLIVVALAARSGTVVGLVIGAVTIAFFHAKAAWEEQRLAERFADYRSYAAVTPRFLPRPFGPRCRNEG